MISDNQERFMDSLKKDCICQVGDTFCQKPISDDLYKTNVFNPLITGFEKDMKDSLLGKVMENFEATIMKETKKLDEMKRDLDIKQSLSDKDRCWQHIPVTLRNEGVDVRDLWQLVNNLFVGQYTNEDKTKRNNCSQNLNPDLLNLLLSHGIGAWLSTLSRDHYDVLAKHIYCETSLWISKIWRFRCSGTFFHQKLYDGVLSVCKVALATHFPKYQPEGFNTLFNHPPVIYLNSSVDVSLINVLRANLGLPHECIRLVPNHFRECGYESMDTAALELLIKTDIRMGKVPLLICTYAGSPNTDSMDQLCDIHQLCKNYRIWLHIEGSRLSELALLHVPAKVNTITSKVKSMTLDIGKWLGIPCVPYITLVVTTLPESYMHTLGYGAGYFSVNRTAMDIFPLWISLQLIGHDGIIKKIENQLRQNYCFVKRLKEIKNIKYICRNSLESDKSPNSEHWSDVSENDNNISSVMNTVLTFMLDGHQIPFVILFRYYPNPQVLDNGDIDSVSLGLTNGFVNCPESGSNEPVSENTKGQAYVDSLNHWLADNLLITFPQINISVIDLPSEGICVRLCLHDNNIGQAITEEILEAFPDSITKLVTFMNATVKQRHIFYKMVKTKRQISFLNLHGWAGLGCVIFIPEIYRDNLFEASVEDRTSFNFDYKKFAKILSVPSHFNEINKINKILVDKLRNSDEAFSMGLYDIILPESSDILMSNHRVTLVCIRFGLITDMTSIEQLIQAVVKNGNDVEVSTRNLTKLTELVKDGIVKVNEQLAKEQEEQMKEQGVLRQLPYIDSIINWIYPTDRIQITGRSLNLSSGELLPTDDTYKYKMQLKSSLFPDEIPVKDNTNVS